MGHHITADGRPWEVHGTKWGLRVSSPDLTTEMDMQLPLLGVHVDRHEVDLGDPVVRDEVGSNEQSSRIDQRRLSLPVEPLEPNFEQMVAVDGLHMCCHFTHPVLIKKDQNWKIAWHVSKTQSNLESCPRNSIFQPSSSTKKFQRDQKRKKKLGGIVVRRCFRAGTG